MHRKFFGISAPLFAALNRRWGAIVFYLVLFVGVVFLAMQQMNWFSHASQIQLNSARKDLAINIAKTLDTTTVGIRQALLEVLSNPDQEHPLVRSYNRLGYNEGWGAYESNELTDKWRSFFDRWLTQDAPYRVYQMIERVRADDVFILLEANGSRQLHRDGVFSLHIVELDIAILTEEYLLGPLHDDLEGYDFTLMKGGATLFSTLDAEPLFQPEASMPLLASMRIPPLDRANQTYMFKARRSVQDNDRRQETSETFRSYESILRAIDGDERQKQSSSQLTLSVYNPGEPLEAIADRQRLRGAVFSAGVLLLLTVTAIVLFRATRRLQALRVREREFVASVSHELRTPLTVIRSAADNLRDGIVSTPDSVVRYGEEITKQSKRLEHMIETTLLFSRLPSPDRLNPVVVESGCFFEELLQPFRQICDDQGIRLKVDYQLDEANICIDRDAVRLIVENMLMNAIIHGQPVEQPGTIWLDIGVSHGQIRVSVADNGLGIPKQEQKPIFAAFTRGQRSEAEQHAGSGLGLNLVQRTVSALGGKIELESPYRSRIDTLAPGAKFNVILPLLK